MRQAFCDESFSRSPFFVVAGPIIHTDSQLVPVEEYLESLVEKYIPKEDRKGFAFHSADVWNNWNYFADKVKWPRRTCWDILWDLSGIPAHFGLPVALGLKRKEEVAEWIAAPLEGVEEKFRPKAHDVATRGIAFVEYAKSVEGLLRELWPNETAELVAENRSEVEESLNGVHLNMRSRHWFEQEWEAPPPEFPFTKIRGAIKFAAKRNEVALQIAGVCAYVIRAACESSLDHAPFYNRLQPLMLGHPKHLDWPPLEWPLGPLVPLWKESNAESESPLGRIRRIVRRDRRLRLSNTRKRNVK